MKQYLILVLVAALVAAAPDADKVTALNGYYDFTGEFQMWSGYLTLQEEPLIANHYLFITSKDKPETDDLVLWLNGGPGCSSLLGFIQQFGPHVLKQGADKLEPTKNEYAWNNHANMLFIESPPGVGFSINNDPAYKIYNDTRTAQDNYNSLKAWFKKFPQFSKNRFWISGESYAGRYLPTLAEMLIKNPDGIVEGGKLDFQGMLIGNGAMNMDLYWRTKVPVAYFDTHYYFGPQIHALYKTCKFDKTDDNNPACLMGLKLADQVTARLNAYNPIGICYNPHPIKGVKTTKKRGYSYTPFYRKRFIAPEDEEPDCDTDDSGLIAYFNDKTVQKQLHVKEGQWTPCSDSVWQGYNMWGGDSVPLFDSVFKAAGLKIMLYSGNVDAVVPQLETDEYIRQINWKVTTPKYRVQNNYGSLEGWVTKYENNLVYYIINAAGHMVPCEKPAAALNMFENFIQGKL